MSGVLATPRVPSIHALLEYRDVLVVRHESTSNSGAAPNDSTVRSGAPQGKRGFPSPRRDALRALPPNRLPI